MVVDEAIKCLPKINVFEVLLDDKNTKLHPQQQLNLLNKVFQKYRFDTPITIGVLPNGFKMCVDGNGRVLALRQLATQHNKTIQVPYILKKFTTKEEMYKYSIEKNAVCLETRFDKKNLTSCIFDISQKTDYLDLLDYDVVREYDIDISPLDDTQTEENNDNIEQYNILMLDDEAKQPCMLKIPNAYKIFEDRNMFDIPILQDKFIFNDDIDKIISFADRQAQDNSKSIATPNTYAIVNYYCNSYCRELKLPKILSFFVYDDVFENVYSKEVDYKQYLQKDLEAKDKFWLNETGTQKILDRLDANNINIIVEPNFSLLYQEPMIYRLLSIYKMHWCGNFWGNYGKKIIPCVSVTDNRTTDLIIDTFPNYSRYFFIVGKENALLLDDEVAIKHEAETIDKYIEKMKTEKIFIYGTSLKSLRFYIKVKGALKHKNTTIEFLNSDQNIIDSLLQQKLNSKHSQECNAKNIISQ